MSSRFVQALRLELRFSSCLFTLGLLLHVLAMTVIFILELPASWLFVIALVVVSHTSFYVMRSLPLLTKNRQVLILRSDGSCTCETLGKDPIEKVLGGNHYVSPLLIVMRFRNTDGKTSSILILPWEYDRDLMRRLRVFLHHAEAAESRAVPR